MCFRTAKLPAPAATVADTKAVTKLVGADFATYTVKAVPDRPRTIQLRVGKRESTVQFAQLFSPAGLREFASQLNVLASQLEA